MPLKRQEIVVGTIQTGIRDGGGFGLVCLGNTADAFWEACDIAEQKPISSSVHCWKQAVPINPINQDSLFVESESIGACGDWCTAPRIEGAVLSGFSMADRVMKHISKFYS